jgi:hypothetical protein
MKKKASRKKSSTAGRPAVIAATGLAIAGAAAVVIGRRKSRPRAETAPAAESGTTTPLAPVSSDNS